MPEYDSQVEMELKAQLEVWNHEAHLSSQFGRHPKPVLVADIWSLEGSRNTYVARYRS